MGKTEIGDCGQTFTTHTRYDWGNGAWLVCLQTNPVYHTRAIFNSRIQNTVNESIEMDHSPTEKSAAAKDGYYLPNTQPHIRMSRDSYFDDTASESSHATAYDSGPEARAGPAFGGAPVDTIDVGKKDGEVGPTVVNVPSQEGLSYALVDEDGVRTNKGKTAMIMALLSEMWIIHIIILIGGIFLWSFFVPQFYVDDQLWNYTCWWKLGELFSRFLWCDGIALNAKTVFQFRMAIPSALHHHLLPWSCDAFPYTEIFVRQLKTKAKGGQLVHSDGD